MLLMTFLLSAPDAGCERIISPGQYVQLGTPYPVKARFKNYGDVTVSFPVYFRIDTVGGNLYSSSSSVSDLVPGDTHTIAFSPNWTPPVFGTYIAYAWSDLAGDSYHGDDTCLIYIKCYHDAQPLDVFWPYYENSVGIPIQPVVRVKNRGSYTEGIPLKLNIYAPGGSLVYSGNTTTPSVTPDSQSTVQLPTQWTPSDTGTYTAELITTLNQDFYPENDTFREDFKVTYEIIYDQGIVDQFMIPSADYYNNKMAVRFTPTITPPLYITDGRIFLNTYDSLDYVMICRSSGSLPDTTNPLFITYNLHGDNFIGSWASFSVSPSLYLGSAQDVWIVAHWRPTSPMAPAVGCDFDVPVDGRSWYFLSYTGWVNYGYGDWMMRLTQSKTVGLEESASDKMLSFAINPNPCRGRSVLSLSLPLESWVDIDLFGVDGRHLENLFSGKLEPGSHRITLLPNSSPGVYFLRIGIGDRFVTRKLVITR
ncbi:MAG: T9SS type A sorting domain-containing protein [candidate division WOR-3 bacterium]